MKAHTLFAILSLGALRAAAAPLVDTHGWQEVDAPGFTLYSQMSADATNAWARKLNQFLFATAKVIPADPRSLPRLRLMLFADRGDFWNLTPELRDGNPLQDIGAFSHIQPTGYLSSSCYTGSEEDTQLMLFSGCVAWYTENAPRPLPRALKVGLNQVYSTYAVVNGSELIGRPIRGVFSQLKAAVNHPMAGGNRFLRVEELLSENDINKIEARHAVGLYYAESWGFIHFLLLSREMAANHGLDRLIGAFGRESRPHEALALAFGAGAASLDLKFRNYCEGGDFYQISRPIEAAPELAAVAHAASPVMVATMLSRLATSAHRVEASTAYAERAISLAPDSPVGYEALAYGLDQNQKTDAALAACDQAISRHSTQAWTVTLRARELARAKAPPAPPVPPEAARNAINVLEAAINTELSFRPAYLALASLVGPASHVTEDDGKFLELGAALFPAEPWLEVGRAEWAHRRHDDALALAFLDAAQSRSAGLSKEQSARASELRRRISGTE